MKNAVNPMVDLHFLIQIAGKWLPAMTAVTIKSSLVLTAAAAASRILRHRDASIRHIISLAALYGILFMPLAPEWKLPVKWPQYFWASAADTGSFLMIENTAARISSSNDLPDEATGIEKGPIRATQQYGLFHWTTLALFSIWIGGIVFLLVRFISPYILLLLNIHRTGKANHGMTAEVTDLARNLNFRRPVSIVLSQIQQAPLTIGLFRPKIVLPREVIRWPLDFRQSVILHELAHTARYDVPTRFIAQLFCIFFWFNPLIWRTLRRVIQDSECASDEWVLKTGVPRSLYAEHLLQAVSLRPPQALSILGSASLARKNEFKQRLESLVNRTDRRPIPKKITYLLIFTTCLFWLPVAGIRISPENSPSNSSENVSFTSPDEIPAFTQTDIEQPEKREPTNTSIPSIWPLDQPEKGSITSGIGIRIHPISRERSLHMGIDIAADKGTAVLATADGTVKQSRFHTQLGHALVIAHTDGYMTLYHHLDSRQVSAGDRIKQGELIGRVGETGVALGPHLHYEVHHFGLVMDPEDFFPRRGTTAAGNRGRKNFLSPMERKSHE